MFYTRCKTTCSKPWSFLRGGRRKRTPSKPHQGRNGNAAFQAMEGTTQARERQEEAMLFYEQKLSRDRRSRDDLQQAPSKTLLQKNEALEKHVKTVNIEGGVLGNHGGGLLQDAPRSPRRSTEAPERARSAAEPAKHRHTFHAKKTAQCRKKKRAHAWITKGL